MGDKNTFSGIKLLNFYLFKSLSEDISLWLKNSDNSSIVTLSCRNVFELYLIMLETNENNHSLKRFFAQLDGDREQVNSAFIEKCNSCDYRLSEESLNILKPLDVDPYLKDIERHNFNMRNLANKHGYLGDYKFIYKLSSKLIHPSAFKVLAIDSDSQQYDVIAMSGCGFVSKATDFAVNFHNSFSSDNT
ncbi:hypothetical protein AL543_05445 [Vibrio mimicus]|nr:hypothetical protein AL543_05445 [Vibrio mimicus]